MTTQGQAVTVPLTDAIFSSGVEVGQVIKLIRVPPADDRPAEYQFSDFERSTPLIVFTVLFAVAVIAVARWRGFASLIGLAFAGFILVKFMFPALISGSNPIMVGLIGSSAIMFVVLYAAHGFSARTSTALVGTLFGLILIAATRLGRHRVGPSHRRRGGGRLRPGRRRARPDPDVGGDLRRSSWPVSVCSTT